MNKKIVSVLVFCFFVSLFVNAKYDDVQVVKVADQKKSELIVLKNPLMALIDGKSFGINADTFFLIVKSRREVRKRLVGIFLEDKTKVGFYDFEGKKYFLSELVDLENKLKLKEDADSKAKIAEMQKLLHWAKEDFIKFTSEYMDSAKGMKGALLGIMKEFHEKSGLGEFFLLDWVKIPDGGEMESVRKNVVTFGNLQTLLTEMSGFLEAMARSCPKGEALFKKKLEAARHKE